MSTREDETSSEDESKSLMWRNTGIRMMTKNIKSRPDPHKLPIIADIDDISSNFEAINLCGRQFFVTKQAFVKIRIPVINNALVIFNKKLNQNEYFLTRNATCFSAILDYLENGELHMPETICPLALKRELRFWRVNIQNMENCCKRQVYEAETEEKAINEFDMNKKKRQKFEGNASNKWSRIRKRG